MWQGEKPINKKGVESPNAQRTREMSVENNETVVMG